MGGKGGSAPPPPPPPDTGMQQDQMMQMMQVMMAMSQSAGSNAGPPAAPELPPIPEVIRETPIDWVKKHEELQEKMSSTYKDAQKKRRNTADTIKTDSLLDEEEPNTTESLLAG